jgi:predicted DNA-binding WGR domain protein
MSKTIKESDANIKIIDSIKNYILNYTDINANSNKFYSLEIVKSLDNNYYLYTQYGRTGGTKIKEYRQCDNLSDAEKEADKIIKSKIKKGYVSVDLLKTEVGSEIVKTKIKTSQISVSDLIQMETPLNIECEKSVLHEEVQGLIKSWFGITNEFIELNLDTYKCSLGQLSIEQIKKI